MNRPAVPPPSPATARLGTVDYLAPEVLDCPVKAHPKDNKDNPNIGYTNKVDCWSIGVLAYELLVGTPPFAAVRNSNVCMCVATHVWCCVCEGNC